MDDEFALNVMLELAEQLKFSKEQLDQFARAEPPKDFEEAMTRPDAKLYELATAVELSAFDKYDVIEHNVSRGELTVRGIDGKTIPMQLLFEVKRNEDGSYLKHKCRCILLGHLSFDRRCEPNDVGFFKDVGVGPNEAFNCGSFRARSVVVFESASCT